MEIHPPDHAIHTWRDFFIHMATICLGLIIALGLEQTVEAIHHAHQRRELHEALQQDAAKTVRDAPVIYRQFSCYARWNAAREAQVLASLREHRPLAAPPPFPHPRASDAPLEAAWTAAKASGLVALMPQDEVEDYTELDVLFQHLKVEQEVSEKAVRQRRAFEEGFCGPQAESGCDSASFAEASPADLREYIHRLSTERLALLQAAREDKYLYNAEKAMLGGEHRLHAIQAAETAPMPGSDPSSP